MNKYNLKVIMEHHMNDLKEQTEKMLTANKIWKIEYYARSISIIVDNINNLFEYKDLLSKSKKIELHEMMIEVLLATAEAQRRIKLLKEMVK